MRSLRPSGRCEVFIIAALAAGFVTVLAGCEKPYRPLPYVPKSARAPEPLVCHDAIGHIKGNKPWILGGTCCCTPTRENYRLHVKQGTIPASMTYDEYLAKYRQRGIVTDLDHKGCGNLCRQGPHVVLGGKCMATPMYEKVTFGPHEPLVVGGAAPRADASGGSEPPEQTDAE